MQGGVFGGFCLLAFLLSRSRAEELEPKVLPDVDQVEETESLRKNSDLEASRDLKSDINLDVIQSNSRANEGRSGDVSGSDVRSFEDPDVSDVAQTSGNGYASAYADSIGGSSQSKAFAAETAPTSPFNPFNEVLGPYIPPGSSFSQPEAHAINSDSYGQGLKSYSNPASFPYNSGLPAQTQADSGLYQPPANVNPQADGGFYQRDYNHYGQGLNSAHNGLPNVSPYNQESSFPPGQTDSESNQPILEPNSVLPKPVRRLSVLDSRSTFSSSYPYSPGTSLNSIHTQDNNVPYQPIPIPNPNPSTFDKFLVPYREHTFIQQSEPSSKQPDADSRLNIERSYSVDKFPSSHSTHFTYHSDKPESSDDRELYQANPNPRPYESNMVPYVDSSYSQKQINNRPDQPVLVPDSNPIRYESSMVQQKQQNSEKNKHQDDGNAYDYQSSPNTKADAPMSSSSTILTARTHEYNSVIDETNSKDDLSKSGWNPYENSHYSPSGVYPQLYHPGTGAVQSYRDSKHAAKIPYRLGVSSYASGYPSESPFRPGVYNPNETQGQPNLYASEQSLPIAFEDAKSRVILPDEYVFPNKMPGGENAVQCRKENEFHHFWSRGMDCLVCICLNEYGVLQPVCASCGGCDNPSPKLSDPVPKLPESITVQPATPGPFELFPTSPPDSNTALPPLDPDQTIPTPQPVPKYQEPIQPSSPVPVTFPESVATLPPPPDQAHCNPLPTGVPFTNPLHPCQICICHESSVTGKTTVSIECKENPQCISPSDITTLPPLPDVPMPVPLPICEKFPEHVLFPHPTEGCKLCMCAKNLSEDGFYEQQITCYPHPDCADPYHEKPNPEPGSEPMEPVTESSKPLDSVLLPEVVTVGPLPWPPITTIAPVPLLPVTPRPGPLPGPSPHESCRPFPPNQTFLHPWDDCQVCICTESTAVGMITVEVNCYTKPECCIEPPDSVKNALPGFNTQPAVQALPSGLQTTTSTFRPPPSYPSYSPRPVHIYPVTNTATDPLKQAPAYSGYVDPASSYPYQPTYAPQYGNPQYPEFPPRLSVLPSTGNTLAQYNHNNLQYPANYQYAQGDAVENNFPLQGNFQRFDQRFQTVPALPYPGMYQRAFDRPHIYLPQFRDGFVKPPVPALGGPNLQNLAPAYAAPIGYAKSGKDEPDDDSR